MNARENAYAIQIAETLRNAKNGINPHVKDWDGNTPLHHLVSLNEFDGVKALIAMGADVNARNHNGTTPLLRSESLEMSQLLLQHGADEQASDRFRFNPLFMAARKGNTEMASFFLERGLSVRETDSLDGEVLHHAKTGEMASLLIQHGADVNQKNLNGCTPLFNSMVGGKDSVARALIDAGADVNVINNRGESLLHAATSDHHLEITKTLIHSGIELNTLDDDDRTPLLKIVALKGSEAVAKRLIQAGADVTIKDGYGKTALHYTKDSPTLQALLLDAGADPMVKDKKGKLPQGEPCDERRKIIKQRQHLEKHLAQVPSPAQVSASVGQGEGVDTPKRRRL